MRILTAFKNIKNKAKKIGRTMTQANQVMSAIDKLGGVQGDSNELNETIQQLDELAETRALLKSAIYAQAGLDSELEIGEAVNHLCGRTYGTTVPKEHLYSSVRNRQQQLRKQYEE